MWDQDFEHTKPKSANPVLPVVIILLLVTVLVGGGVWLWFSLRPKQEDVFPALQRYIQQTGELTTIKYNDADWFEADRNTSWWGSTVAVCVLHGEVLAGVDLEQLGRQDVENDGETLTITLPPAKILNSHNVLVESRSRCRTFREGVNVLLDAGDTSELAKQLETQASQLFLQHACEEQVLDQANEQAAAILKAFLSAAGFENVRIKTQQGACP